jgi:hypothetical protein
MGLFDRLRGLGQLSNNAASDTTAKVAATAAEANPTKTDNTFFLDPDASMSMGDVNFMRRSNTIRRTFPGNADSPGNKEMVAEVASMEAELKKMTPGLAGTPTEESVEVSLTAGVPKPVKKTFAQQMSSSQLAQKMKGSALAVNTPGGAAARKASETSESNSSATGSAAKAGAIDPFKAMARDLNT